MNFKALKCGANQIGRYSKKCGRTCLDPQGKKYCGNEEREGCFCQVGFVRNSQGECVKPEQCGCRVPNKQILIGVGRSVVDIDCSKRYTCNGPQQNAQIDFLRKCSRNAVCRGNHNNVPTCFCKPGFEGDGYRCRRLNNPNSTTPVVNPCKVSGVCGRGASCINRNGKAQCLCRGQIVDNKASCCNRELRCL
jgi:hypothetical protein